MHPILLVLGLVLLAMAGYVLREELRQRKLREAERSRKPSRIRSLLPPVYWRIATPVNSVLVVIVIDTIYDRVFSSFNSWIDRHFKTETQANWVSNVMGWVVDRDLFYWVAILVTFVFGMVIFALIHKMYFRDDQAEALNNESKSRMKWVNIAVPGLVGVTAVVMAAIGMKKNGRED